MKTPRARRNRTSPGAGRSALRRDDQCRSFRRLRRRWVIVPGVSVSARCGAAARGTGDHSCPADHRYCHQHRRGDDHGGRRRIVSAPSPPLTRRRHQQAHRRPGKGGDAEELPCRVAGHAATPVRPRSRRVSSRPGPGRRRDVRLHHVPAPEPGNPEQPPVPRRSPSSTMTGSQRISPPGRVGRWVYGRQVEQSLRKLQDPAEQTEDQGETERHPGQRGQPRPPPVDHHRKCAHDQHRRDLDQHGEQCPCPGRPRRSPILAPCRTPVTTPHKASRRTAPPSANTR